MKTALISLAAVAVAGVPGVASASTISVDGAGTAVYRAAPREANALQLVDVMAPLRFVDQGAMLTAGPGCTPGTPVICDARGISASLGDRNDRALVNSFTPGDVVLDAGSGDDDVLAGANDRATASGGPGNDIVVVIANGQGTASGGPGDDQLGGRSSGDDLSGDGGMDLLAVRAGFTPATLAGGDGADRLVGNMSAAVSGGSGNDLLIGGATLDGGAGADRIKGTGGSTISGGAGSDAIDAADGSGAPDTISCGSGFDAVWADPEDTVAPDCELRTIGLAPALPGVAGAVADAQALLAHQPAFG